MAGRRVSILPERLWRLVLWGGVAGIVVGGALALTSVFALQRRKMLSTGIVVLVFAIVALSVCAFRQVAEPDYWLRRSVLFWSGVGGLGVGLPIILTSVLASQSTRESVRQRVMPDLRPLLGMRVMVAVALALSLVNLGLLV